MSDMDSLINLIDERILMALKKFPAGMNIMAKVVSYDSGTKQTVVTFRNDTVQATLKNLSSDVLVAGDTVIVWHKNNSNLSSGHIYGKISI